MKVIFLDIDGVLNSDRSHLAIKIDPKISYSDRLFLTLDPIAIGLLNRLIEKSKAKIILSTSHRTKCLNLKEVQTFLNRMNIIGEGFGVTPTLLGTNRGQEIQTYLDANEVENYLILDDSSDMLNSQLDNFVRVDPAIGLSAQDYYKACKILNVQESSLLI